MPSFSSSYFLFGARGTGKTTLLSTVFNGKKSLLINLLDPEEEDLFSKKPGELKNRIALLPDSVEWIIIDEIQRVPKLLDLVHNFIETTNRKFVLTGSSARKLKRGASNLLAGRAFVQTLYPLTAAELGESFNLIDALQWGTLPKIYQFGNSADKANFLRAYAHMYLKEEIVAEQIVRNLDPFRLFLEIAAQTNGKIVNFSKIADDVGADTKTVQTYFSILEETLVGFLLQPWHRSIRKQQRTNPKFYYFDCGVKRALDRTLEIPLQEGTYGFGDAFEHFVIIEIMRRCSYARPDWRLAYLMTKDGAEIDLIIDRPGLPTALIEIKSAARINERDVSRLNRIIRDIDNSEAWCLSRDRHEKKIDNVQCIPWEHCFDKLGITD